MICGWPDDAMPGYDSPTNPHSSYVLVNGDLPLGGLIDGPIYNQLFQDRAGAALTREDAFAALNNGIAVYHDDIGDYSSNEPTMDGTAGLVAYAAALEARGKACKAVKDAYGAIDRQLPAARAQPGRRPPHRFGRPLCGRPFRQARALLRLGCGSALADERR